MSDTKSPPRTQSESAAKRQATLAAKRARIQGAQRREQEAQARNRRIIAAEKLARDPSTTEHERQAAREAAARLKAVTPPPSISDLPHTIDWDAAKRRATANRKAKRAAKAARRASLADLREAHQ
jgi:hypothetical protein